MSSLQTHNVREVQSIFLSNKKYEIKIKLPVLEDFNFKTEPAYLIVDLQAEVFRKAVIVYIVLSQRREPKSQSEIISYVAPNFFVTLDSIKPKNTVA